MRVLTAEQVRAADRHAIEGLGIPAAALMESAGAEVARFVADAVGSPEGARVLVLCGRGNNGGDGMVAARRLLARGADVAVALLADPSRLSADAAQQWAILTALDADAAAVDEGAWPELADRLEEFDVVVDALLGTGFRGELQGLLARAVRDVNASSVPVVAVDVPSGASGSSASLGGTVMEAAATVALAAPKICHVLPPACLRCGDVAVVDIGIPEASLDEAGADLELLDDGLVGAVVEDVGDRPEESHKGSFGHVVVVAGAVGSSGAATLAGRAALAAGAGLVTVAAPAPCVPSVAAGAPELMQLELAATEAGAAAGDGEHGPILERATVLVIGPGLGTGDGARTLVATLLREARVPIVLDADGLNLVAAGVELGRHADRPLVLTPHPGEFARLLHGPSARADALGDAFERASQARQLSVRAGATVLLKGFRSLVASPDGPVLVNPTGGPGLATAGSGDVLAGLVGGLLAQGLSAPWAAAAGAYLHGRAGDLAEAEHGQAAMVASDVIAAFPAALRSVVDEDPGAEPGD